METRPVMAPNDAGDEAASAVEPRRRRLSARWIVPLCVLALTPCLALALHVYLYGGTLPLQDQWATPGLLLDAFSRHSLRWQYFFVQHNEARKAFSGAVWFLMALNGWEVRDEMYLSLVLVFSGVLAVLAIARAALPGAALVPALCAVVASALLFNPYGLSNAWLWGVNLENAIVATALLLGVAVNLCVRDSWLRCATLAALCLAATFTFTSGLALWVLLWPRWFRGARALRGSTDARESWVLEALHAALSVTVTWWFFHHWIRPAEHPPVSASLGEPGRALQFFLAWLGAPLAPIQHSTTSATLVGGLAFGAFLVCGVAAVTRRGWARAAPWLAISGYTIAAGAAVAAGRSSLGVAAALPPRYVLHVSLFYVGLHGLIWLLVSTAKGRGARRTMTAAACATVALIAALIGWQWHDSFEKHVRIQYENTARGETALRFARLAPDNPDLEWIYPDAEVVVHVYGSLERAGILAKSSVPPLDALLVEDHPLSQSAHLALNFDGRQLRAQGYLDSTQAVRDFTHLLLYSETEREHCAVVPLRVFTKSGSLGARNLDLEFPLGGLEDGVHLTRLFGYDSVQERLTPLDVELELRKGPVPESEAVALAGEPLVDAEGGVTLESIQRQPVLGLDELTLTNPAPVLVSGWAIDEESGRLPREVFVRVGARLFRAHTGTQRLDVAAMRRDPTLRACGLYCLLPWEVIADPNGVELGLVIRDHEGDLRQGPRLTLRARGD